jgi:hypothetical protein
MGPTKQGRAQADVQAIAKACQTFRVLNGHYPDHLDQITSMLEQGQAGLIDPWGNPYQYQPPSDPDSTDPKDGTRISNQDHPRHPRRGLCDWVFS